MERGNVRIKDVALVAGVSTATVSRTLTNPSLVNETTRKAVFSAIEKTGYVFNEAASNFRRQRTGTIVAFIPNISNPYYPTILSGISSVVAASGFSLTVVDTRAGLEAERVGRQYFNNKRADGLIVMIGSIPDELAQKWTEDGNAPPIVQIGEWPAGMPSPRVTIRNAKASRLAVQHLIELGHRKIGFLSGPKNFTTDTRLSGMIEALNESNVPFNPGWVFEGELSYDAGRTAAFRWLQLEDRPTGVFCYTDVVACGFMGELLRQGVMIPQQLSIVGFDDIEVMQHIHPALTTIRQPRRQMGEKAAEILTSLIETGAAGLQDTVLDAELVIRASTAAPATV
jgi:LacI family repressor for deo operon, udp, cdd, tsx, nupC, and nupG